MSWADVPFARLTWPDAPSVDSTVELYLDIAHGPVAAYAPAPAVEGDPPVEVIPDSWKYAEIVHARDLFAAARRDGDVLGFDDGGAALRVRPLSPVVKALLRPSTPGSGLVG